MSMRSEFSPLTHLAFLRDQYSDEIPQIIIHSTAKNNRFKVRKAWFAGVVGDLEIALTDGLITDPDTVLQANNFIDKYSSKDFNHQERTTADDIAAANAIIGLILVPTPGQ